jgi:hypothetical protein
MGIKIKRLLKASVIIYLMLLLSVLVSGCCFGFLHHCDTEAERQALNYCQSKGATESRASQHIHQQEVPFDTVFQDDGSMRLGEIKVIQEGVKGLKERTITYTYGPRDGDEYKCNEDETPWVVKTEPVNKILARGTIVDAIVPAAPPAPVIVTPQPTPQPAPQTVFPNYCDCYSNDYYPECDAWYAQNCSLASPWNFGGYGPD